MLLFLTDYINLKPSCRVDGHGWAYNELMDLYYCAVEGCDVLAEEHEI